MAGALAALRIRQSVSSSLCPLTGLDHSHPLALVSTVSPAQAADLSVVYRAAPKYIAHTKEARGESGSPRPTKNLIPTSGVTTADWVASQGRTGTE